MTSPTLADTMKWWVWPNVRISLPTTHSQSVPLQHENKLYHKDTTVSIPVHTPDQIAYLTNKLLEATLNFTSGLGFYGIKIQRYEEILQHSPVHFLAVLLAVTIG